MTTRPTSPPFTIASLPEDNASPPDSETPASATPGDDLVPRVLTPAAERALAEAAERRRVAEALAAQRAREIGGQKGPDPVRYGDWEKGGIVSDF